MAFVRHVEPHGLGNGNGARSAEAWEGLLDQERRRLAMLWNAFEEAETRVHELETLLERQRVVIAPAAQAVAAAREDDAPHGLRPQPRYPVDMHKVAKLPGITATEVERLRTYGVNLSDEFLHIDLDKLAEATNIPRDRLQRWRDMCELMGVQGIGPTWAERLVDAGVGSIRALASLEPGLLKDTLVQSYQASGGKAQGLVLLERTLPARCRRLIAAAEKAERSL